jgi:hypothetical protein
LPIGLIVPSFALVAVFPLTLAYVILVDRAMDVRVALRQGLRYAVTRGAIRTVVVALMALVLWNAWNLVNDPRANRPRKLQAIAFGMAVAVLVPRFSKRAFDWTDREVLPRGLRRGARSDRLVGRSAHDQRRPPRCCRPCSTASAPRCTSTGSRLLARGGPAELAGHRGFAQPPGVTFDARSDDIAR